MPCNLEVMITRRGEKLVKKLLKMFPAVCIVGSRQCGKTTLAKSLSEHYYDLETPSERVRLDVDWKKIITGDDLIVMDEAHSDPAMFNRLRSAIDLRRAENGRFLLLGSVSPALMKKVSESLAGRMAIIELAPFSLTEVGESKMDHLWRYGGFPTAFNHKENYPHWHKSYLSQLAHRDLPEWGLAADPIVTMKLFKMLATLHGSAQNASQIGKVLGLSHHTVQSYLNFLEGAFLIRRIPPFFANLNKRLVKTPKVYWRDSGIVHHLLGHSPKMKLASQKYAGTTWEGMVIEQILATHHALGNDVTASYFRTSDGLECDLVLEVNGRRELIEIKLSTSPNPSDLVKLRTIKKFTDADRIVLLTRHDESHTKGNTWVTNLPSYLAKIS